MLWKWALADTLRIALGLRAKAISQPPFHTLFALTTTRLPHSIKPRNRTPPTPLSKTLPPFPVTYTLLSNVLVAFATAFLILIVSFDVLEPCLLALF